jgi:uncharacterized coiled-coil DUF342 family protein
MEKQLDIVLEKMEKLKERRKELKNEAEALHAEYKQLTNQYYELMLKHIPREYSIDADLPQIESQGKKKATA